MTLEVTLAPKMSRGSRKILAGTAVLLAVLTIFSIGAFILMFWSLFELLMMPF